MNNPENTELLKYLGDFALIHQKMALSVHLKETFPSELAESKSIVCKLNDETRAYEAEALRLATGILRLFLLRDPIEEDVYKANNWWF